MVGPGGQTQRMQAALSPVLVIGPDFLVGRLGADDMARTMVRAVQEYADGERARQPTGVLAEQDAAPVSAPAAQQLQAALAEIYTCGSGYLADRCDSDCVARTMVQIMDEFGDLAPGRGRE
jgi:hypothetical protein